MRYKPARKLTALLLCLMLGLWSGATPAMAATNVLSPAASSKYKSDIAPTKVTLNKGSMTLLVGKSETLKATVLPLNASNKEVSWQSSDPSVASVDKKGRVSGKKAGNARITVRTKQGSKTATCLVTVGYVAVSSIRLNKTNLTIGVDDTFQLEATIKPAGASNQEIRWESSDSLVVSVDKNGRLTGVGQGNSTVTAQTEDGRHSAICMVKVSYIPATSIKLDKANISLAVGSTESLAATIGPEEATNKKVGWQSNDPKVASVDEAGKVTGKKVGTAVITATSKDKNLTATCTVSVFNIPAESVSLDKTRLNLAVGSSVTLQAAVSPANANRKLKWRSSNPAVAEVDDQGKVTGKKAGSALITTTTIEGGKTAACEVTVGEVAVSSIKLDRTKISLPAGSNLTLKVTFYPANASNREITWKSSDRSVATVDQNGKITAIKAGIALITAKTRDSMISAGCFLTVVKR
ncbi:MAG: Ig-like domain-containing protein [Syntrophomonadaceae bacterium]